MSLKMKPLASAISFALLASATNISLSSQVWAEEAEAEQERITVTGSRLKRTDFETAKPITVITAEDIARTGQTSVAEVLRDLPFATTGSFLGTSGNSAANHSSTGLRGLSADRTLVLINGRRIAGSATVGASQVNLNLIPTAAIERIDILRDGASAVYGSDAIGGVINIIMKKDYEGVAITLQHGNPTQGGADETRYSLTFGSSSNKSRSTTVIEHLANEGLKGGERPHISARPDVEGFEDYGTAVYSEYGIWRPVTVTGETLGEDLAWGAAGFWQPGPNCPEEDISPAGDFTWCLGNIYEGKNHLRSNTTNSIYHTMEYDVTDDLTVFGNVSVLKDTIDVESTALWTSGLGGTGVLMLADNPNNPYGQDIAVFQSLNGVADRKFEFDSLSVDFVAGATYIIGDGELEWSANHSKQESDVFRDDLFLRQLQEQVTAGNYNPLIPAGGPSATEDVTSQFLHTATRTTYSQSIGTSLVWSSTLPLNINGNDIPYSTGYEYRDEEFGDVQDAQSIAGNVLGAFGGNSGGGRYYQAVFFETSIEPIDNLSIDFATRYDQYSLPDVGQLSSSLGIAYTIFDGVKVRTSYSQGFRAPSIDSLLSSEAVSFDSVVDTSRCNAAATASPDTPQEELPECVFEQQERRSSGNLELEPEESAQIAFGFVLEPIEDLEITIDYYDIEIDNQVTFIGAQTVLDLEALGQLDGFPGLSVTRDADGEIDIIRAGNVNSEGIQTSGIDLDISWSYSMENYGELNIEWLSSYLLKYNRQLSPTAPRYDLVGLVGVPEYQSVFSVNYNFGDFTTGLTHRFIDSYEGETPEQLEQEVDRGDFDAFQVVDLYFGYDTGYGQLTVGARNIADELPDPNYELGFPGYDSSLSDIIGRVVYGRYTIEF
ncbi:MAG: TonB-dependent receptor [Pseudomonadota bacterium]